MDINIVREGTVSSVNAENHTVRVIFEDADEVVSADLPVLVMYAGANRAYHLPDVGEVVVCLMTQNAAANTTGFVLGSRYHEKLSPAVNNQDITRIDFADNAYISYNRQSHEFRIQFSDGAAIAHRRDGSLLIENKGDIMMNGRTVNING